MYPNNETNILRTLNKVNRHWNAKMRLKPVNAEQAIYSVYYFRKIPNTSEYQNIKKTNKK